MKQLDAIIDVLRSPIFTAVGDVTTITMELTQESFTDLERQMSEAHTQAYVMRPLTNSGFGRSIMIEYRGYKFFIVKATQNENTGSVLHEQ